ncbi:ATP-binding protein [Salimicrobium jeotgali]|uniref:ATP-binding protein n=1 Tax=Salimicrobium jeotgali TaxID=1230341 RepID=UPI0035B541A0
MECRNDDQDWGVFYDPRVTPKRVVHHSTTFNIKGDSYRLREKKKAGIQPTNLR